MANPKCPYCGGETLLVGSKAYGWHYICNCGAASPVASNPDEAYTAAMKRDGAKGQWISRIDRWNNEWYVCSKCGHEMFFTGTFDSEQRFCYYCGADMRKEVNDERK